MRDLTDNLTPGSWLLPPLNSENNQKFEFDYSLLLLADQLIYDRTSFEVIKSQNLPAMRKIYEALNVLVGEGFLCLEDYGEIADQNAEFLARSVDAASSDFSRWLPALKAQMDAFDELLPNLQHNFQNSFSDWDMQLYPVATYLLRNSGHIKKSDVDYIRALINHTKKRAKNREDNLVLQAVVHTALENVNANLLLADQLDALPYAWGTISGYFETAFVTAAKNTIPQFEHINESRNFFTLAFPEFKPMTPLEWVALFRDSRFKDLRSHIKEAINKEQQIDSHFAKTAILELQQTRAKLDNFKTYSGRLSATASVVGGIAGGVLGGLVGGAVGGLLPSVLHESISTYVEKKELRNHSWLYFTSSLPKQT